MGSTFPGSGADVRVDTLELTELQSDTLAGVSGSLAYFSTGGFQDPVFGDITATGLVKPVLGFRDDSISIDEETTIQLRLTIDTERVYGDSLAAGQFEIFELSNVFRGNEVNVDSEIQTTGSSIGSFTVTNEDTVIVDLGRSWVQKYGEFYNDTTDTRDTTYGREFPGLAIVPQNSAKILAVNPFESDFIISGLNIEGEADSTASDTVGLSQWAYTIGRENVPEPDAGSRLIHRTLERVFWFDFDFSRENLGARNISQVKVVFYRDNMMLDESALGPDEVRPLAGNLRMHLVEGDELPQSIDPGSALGVPTSVGGGSYQSDDEAYYIDISNEVVLNTKLENAGPDDVFYITLGTNNGLIRSSLIYDTEAPAEKTPKVIITSTKTENN